MKNPFFSIFVVVSILLSSVALAEGDGKAPVLYRPTFEVSDGVASAGTAFVIKHDKKYYAVSAQHLIGTAGGLKKDYLGKDMANVFKKVTYDPVYSGYKTLSSTSFVPIENAAPLSDKTTKHDIFISQVDTLDSTPLTLAENSPKVGDRVMLYAVVANSDEVMHSATVARVNEDEFAYIFDDKNINLRATSGAPVINSKYQVVGINLAGGETNDGKVVGWANPHISILKYLP
ncbi:MAG: trypsin-like peptidase domain-containing protein [Kangiellaceae bacterium]|nr:trypsin-like peptidase domain-containing protein [Kangiellaceae bacterium]